MTKRYESEGARPGLAGVLGIVLLAILLGAISLGLFLHQAQAGLAGRLADLITGRSTNFVSEPDVVSKVQRLNRLETVVYSLDTVVEGNESNPVLPDVLAGDKLLLIVHGQTIAGIDFSKLKPESVQIKQEHDGRSIRLQLPPSEVFITSIDNAKTRVYARNTGLFVSADPNLETATRLRAQNELQQAALNDGILETARANARDTVRVLLGGLGFTRIDVQ